VHSLDKLKAELLLIDEVTLMELLEVSTEDLIERFGDRILQRREFLSKEVEIAFDVVEELNFEKE
jgi:hypothetical protein